jgi:uncharacterized membrane-anchored protein
LILFCFLTFQINGYGGMMLVAVTTWEMCTIYLLWYHRARHFSCNQRRAWSWNRMHAIWHVFW